MSSRLIHNSIIIQNECSLKVFENPKIESKNTHGTGCTLASAIATFLGNDLGITKSVHKSIQYVRYLLEKSPDIGAGNGPLHHGLRND